MSADRRPAFATAFCALMRPPANKLCENESPRLYWFLAPKPRLPNEENGFCPRAQRDASSSPASLSSFVAVASRRYWSHGPGGATGLVVSTAGALPPMFENWEASVRV